MVALLLFSMLDVQQDNGDAFKNAAVRSRPNRFVGGIGRRVGARAGMDRLN
jgi:hypothetical protein